MPLTTFDPAQHPGIGALKMQWKTVSPNAKRRTSLLAK